MNKQQAHLVAQVIESHRTYLTACEQSLFGIRVKVTRDVFNPFLAPSGPLMIHLASSGAFTGKRVLDIGCGSGVASALLALKGNAKQVVTVDINPIAVECARENARRFGVTDRVEVREGDLFEPMRPLEKFDVVVADLPFADADPQDMLERAFFDPGLQSVRRCIACVDRVLAPTGVLLLAWSDLERPPWPLSDAAVSYRSELRRRVNGIELSLAEFAVEDVAPSLLIELEATWKDDSLWRRIREIVNGIAAKRLSA